MIVASYSGYEIQGMIIITQQRETRYYWMEKGKYVKRKIGGKA